MRYPFFVIILIIPFFSSAKKFSTSYVSFDLLNNWHCFPEGTDWICANKLNSKSTEAGIIFTAKQRGPSDSLAQYVQHLNKSRKVKEKNSSKVHDSKIFHSKQRVINDHPWADGFQGGSEVTNYYTRYLATVKGSVSVLVTYTAHKDHYNKYASDFAKSIGSLRVLKDQFGTGSKGRFGQGSGQNYLSDMIDPTDELSGDDLGISDAERGLIPTLLRNKKLTGFSILLLTLLAYLWLKKRRKKNKKLLEADRGGSDKEKRSLSRIERIKRHKLAASKESRQKKEKKRRKKSSSRSRSSKRRVG